MGGFLFRQSITKAIASSASSGCGRRVESFLQAVFSSMGHGLGFYAMKNRWKLAFLFFPFFLFSFFFPFFERGDGVWNHTSLLDIQLRFVEILLGSQALGMGIRGGGGDRDSGKTCSMIPRHGARLSRCLHKILC